RMAEVVVAAFDPQGKPLAGALVWLTPQAGQAGGRQGVLADRQGKAWFVVKAEGTYTLSAEGTPLAREITVNFPALTRQAGYGHLQWETLGNGSTAADQERLARPAPYDTKVIPPAAKLSGMPVEEVRPGPFAPDADGFIRDWLLCGPFPNVGDRMSGFTGYKTDYLAGQRGETGIEPKRGMSHDAVFPESKYWQAGKTTNTWRQYHSPESKTNLGSLTNPEVELRMSPPQFVVGYAACYVDSPADRQLLLAIGSDDGYKAWLNHQPVGGDPTHGEAIQDAHLLPVTLKKGRNLLLIKVDQSFNGWEFYARFLAPQTKAPVNDLIIKLE
ncbi:MAG: carboxypeptidase-like regulatory domain-containing protein, partial [Lentisphaeria bacterium]